MGMSSTSPAVTMEELDAVLSAPPLIRFDVERVTARLPMDVLCELATESTGNTARTVQGLIEGVIVRYGASLDDAALAALNAVAFYHVPVQQERLDRFEDIFGAH
jgi:hypothetical protein